MFGPVHKSFLKPLVYLVVAAQLLLAVPAMATPMAITQGAAIGSASMPCDEMPGANHGDHCPCCPDGADSMKDCLASCTLAAAAVSDTPVPARVSAPSLRADTMLSAPLVSRSEPPLNPPPIR